MRYKNIKIGIALLSILTFVGIIPISAVTVYPGNSFTVTLSCGVAEGTVSFSGNANVSNIQASKTFCDRNQGITVTATAVNVGTGVISMTAEDAIDTSDPNNRVQMAAGTLISSASVSIVAQTSGGNTTYVPSSPSDSQQSVNSHKGDEAKSSDNLLSSLSLSKGTLSPAFDPEVTEYNVNLKAGSTATSVSAQAKDTKASIEGTGEKTLVEGDNLVEVKVTAENGDVRTYKINIYVEEKNLTQIKFDKMNYGIVTKVDRLEAPAGFEKTTLAVNGKDVPAWKNADMKLTLLYLRNEDGNKDFYIYDEKEGTVVSLYKPIQIAGKDYIQLSIVRSAQERSGMKYNAKIKIGDLTIDGWEYEDKAYENYVLLYLMNKEGKANYYLYEKSEGTLQIVADMAAVSQSAYDELKGSMSSMNMYMIAGIAGTAVFAVLSGVGFYLNAINKKRYLAHRRELYQMKDQDE